MQRRFTPSLCAMAALATITGTLAHGNLIPGFDLGEGPSLAASFVTVNYSATTNTLTAEGFVFDLAAEDPDGGQPVERGRLAIDATIDEEGAADGGSLSVTGNVPGLGLAGPELLAGELREFGYGTIAPSLGPIQMTFTVTGGDLAETFGGVGAEIGVALSQGLGFPGSWDASFDGAGTTIGQVGVLLDPEDGLASCACRGDANCDGIVDMDDVVMVIMHWGACGPGCEGDVTGNDIVDVQDLVELILHWGTCTVA